MVELYPIVFHGRYFVRHLRVCNRQTSTNDVRCHFAQFSEKTGQPPTRGDTFNRLRVSIYTVVKYVQAAYVLNIWTVRKPVTKLRLDIKTAVNNIHPPGANDMQTKKPMP